MSRKIIGVTVGSPLPKPNLMQTDPAKGDYVWGKEEFLAQAGSGGNVDLTIEGETLVIAEKSTAIIENETLIL